MSAPEITLVDVRGLTITTAIAGAVRANLSSLPVGAEVELFADPFPALIPDLEAWRRFAGHEVASVSAEGAHQRIRLRRTDPIHRVGGKVALVVSTDMEVLLAADVQLYT